MMSAKYKKKGAPVPRLRFPEFQNAGEWEMRYGNDLFDSIINKNQKFDLPILAITQEHGAIPRSTIEYHVSVAEKSIENYKVVNIGDFIISLRSFQGGIEYSHFCGLCSPAYIILRKKVILNDVFFKFFFKSEYLISRLNVNIEGLRDGKMITYKQFSEVLLPFPSPAEQQRIADCLSSLDERIAAETNKLDALKAHKKGLLKQLFPAEGETTPELRFPEFQDAGEWQKKFLDEYSEVVRGGSPRPIDNFLTAKRDGLNWLKIGDINKEAKYVVATTEKVRAEALSKTREISPGDLILSNSMSFGRPYISKIKTCIHDGWIAITEISKKLHVEYIYYLISSPFSQQYFTSNAAGSGVQNLNADIIKSLPIFFPNILEQQRIADCLSSLDELITTQTQKIDLLKEHKKGLMQQLFPRIDEVRA